MFEVIIGFLKFKKSSKIYFKKSIEIVKWRIK